MKNFNDYVKKLFSTIYKVNDVTGGFMYWKNTLLDMSMDLFEYENLPSTLPGEEIERRLLTTGHCGIVQHPKFGLIACDCSLYDYDVYGRFSKANFFNPVQNFNTNFIAYSRTIGKDCSVIYNNSIEKYLNQNIQGTDTFFQCICRYARQLSDIEATINLEIGLNERQTNIFLASDGKTQQGIIEMFRSIRKGEPFVAVDKNLYKDTQGMPLHNIVSGHLTELFENRNRIIKQFQEEVGIFSIDDKEERVLQAELANENRNVKLFIFSMLKARQIGIDSVNELFGTDIRVALRGCLYDDSKLYEETDDTQSDVLNEEENRDEIQND